MRRERSFRETAKHFLDESINAALSIAGRQGGVKPAYQRLLLHVRQHADLLRPRGRCGDRPGNGHCRLNASLLTLALHHADWLRPVESWKPPAANAWPQFTSLAQHLFARYPIPAFMSSVWFEFPPGEKVVYHEWYKKLGLGQSIRKMDLPLAFTKAMVHWFNQAPDHYSVVKALRWAQVRGLGGEENLAGAIAATRLGSVLGHEDFWLSVLHFFVTHPRIDPAHVGPVVDFLQHQRFERREVFVHGVLTKQGPPQPEYSMKSRTLRSLLRQVDEWHDQLGKEETEPSLRWVRCKIREFEFIEGHEHLGNMRRWMITELLTNRELREEGQALHHCVATYGKMCANRQIDLVAANRDRPRPQVRAHHRG